MQKRIFPGGSDGKESACNAGDEGSIPGSGRSPGEGNGNPLQYSCLESPTDRSLAGYSAWGCKESITTERTRMHADAEMKKRGTARVSCTRHQQRVHSPPKPPLGWPHSPPGEGPSPAPAGVRSKGTCWLLFLPRAEAGA